MKNRIKTLSALTWLAFAPSTAFAQCPTPTNYCNSTQNSSGANATMSWTGTPAIEDGDFHLVAQGCPPETFMIFFYGVNQIALPFGNGTRCVAGQISRFNVKETDLTGTLDMEVDFDMPPVGGNPAHPGFWSVGDVWNVQGWFRDVAGGGSGFNLTDGLEIEVCRAVVDPCTPAVQAACIAAGFEPCTSGSADCGPPLDLCTPAISAACEAVGLTCDPLSGSCVDCQGTIDGSAVVGAAGGCCLPTDLDGCGVCFGDGTGPSGCGSGSVCGGVGECVCGLCVCPPPSFGPECLCNEIAAKYNGLFQHSFINPTPDTLMGPSNAISFEGWFKGTKVGNPLATRMGTSGILWGLSIGVPGSSTAANTVRLYNGLSCASCFLDGNTIIPLDEWTHVALTWDPTSTIASIYVNGVLDASGPFVQNPASSGQLLIGLQGSNYYGGLIDDIRMWRTVRTPMEILDNYELVLDGVGDPNLVFNHNMQQWRPSDAECVDFSDSHNNLIHSLFVEQHVNTNPVSQVTGQCPGTISCNGVGSCDCGVCTCFNPTDISYDCGEGL